MLQLGRGLSPRKRVEKVDTKLTMLGASIGPRSFNRGNYDRHGTARAGDPASIGPRSFNRGNCRESRFPIYDAGRFNWAAVFQPRKHGCVRRQGSPLPRFNWAAVFQPRKLDQGIFDKGTSPTLQLGRGLSTAETSEIVHGQVPVVLASIGPRSFNRGNHHRWRFNAGRETASIGPRSFNRGNTCSASSRMGTRMASIGPRSFNRGNIGMGGIAVIVLLASIGPRSFNRGNVHQLGVHIVTGSASIGPRSFNRGIRRRNPCLACYAEHFNRATVVQPRKRLMPTPMRRTSKSFNWAAVFQPRKLVLPPSFPNCWTRFNWAAVFQPRKLVSPPSCRRARGGFNWAAVFQPRKHGGF